ncbi:hypothetical protein G6045_07015 [Streptomyces sp. YC504]|uniref:Lipoprotein n=1 Tax=Streptomyces mesophilus TaxID=1775132 RepID=A0A6G4XDF5_9ACTN|nr:hypothetical protein [Streptomyces mesophilus]NGO75428.1 hypothetical protein [Streptomyces mesophilus]
MHRTTRAALLVSLTVTAVSGCVAVRSPAAPTATPPGPASAPAAKDGAEHRIVQAPAHEALQRIHAEEQRQQRPGTVRTPAVRPDAVRESTRAAVRGSGTDAVRAPGAEPRKDTGSVRPQAQEPPAQPSVDVCALGEQYGGWPSDSPQAQICRNTYGG